MRRAHAAWVGVIGVVAVSGCGARRLVHCEGVNPEAPITLIRLDGNNPEDVEAVPSMNLVLVSQMKFHEGEGGFIAAITPDPSTTHHPNEDRNNDSPNWTLLRLWPPSDGERGSCVRRQGDGSCSCPPSGDAFSPHGIATFEVSPALVRVAVVVHRDKGGGHEGVELFDLSQADGTPRLTWRGCVTLPPDMVANDVALVGESDLVVSNAQPHRSVFYQLIARLGFNTGDIQRWDPEHGWRAIPGTQSRFPNGVLVMPVNDAPTLFYAETGSGSVLRIPLTGGTPVRLSLGGAPDNLAPGDDTQSVLVARHDSPLCAANCFSFPDHCHSPWTLIRFSTSLDDACVIATDGNTLGAVSSATKLGACYYLGAMVGSSIGVVKPSAARCHPAQM